MKKYLSITEYFARRSLLKVLGVVLAMAALQFLFCRGPLASGVVHHTESDGYSYDSPIRLYDTQVVLVFCAVYVLAVVAISLILIGAPAKGTNYGYSIRLLGVSERSWMLLNALYCACCYIIAWAAAIAVLRALIGVYIANPHYDGGPQGVYTELMWDDSLKFFIPADDGRMAASAWIINVLLGPITAAASLKRAQGKLLPAAPAILINVLGAVLLFRWNTPSFFLVLAAAYAIYVLIEWAPYLTGGLHNGKNGEADDAQ